MSLKALHVIFISASILLAFGFGWWELAHYQVTAAAADLWFGIGSCVAGVGLIAYGLYFLKKLKHISYL